LTFTYVKFIFERRWRLLLEGRQGGEDVGRAQGKASFARSVDKGVDPDERHKIKSIMVP
jgi:hypothetical protein